MQDVPYRSHKLNCITYQSNVDYLKWRRQTFVLKEKQYKTLTTTHKISLKSAALPYRLTRLVKGEVNFISLCVLYKFNVISLLLVLFCCVMFVIIINIYFFILPIDSSTAMAVHGCHNSIQDPRNFK